MIDDVENAADGSYKNCFCKKDFLEKGESLVTLIRVILLWYVSLIGTGLRENTREGKLEKIVKNSFKKFS